MHSLIKINKDVINVKIFFPKSFKYMINTFLLKIITIMKIEMIISGQHCIT